MHSSAALQYACIQFCHSGYYLVPSGTIPAQIRHSSTKERHGGRAHILFVSTVPAAWSKYPTVIFTQYLFGVCVYPQESVYTRILHWVVPGTHYCSVVAKIVACNNVCKKKCRVFLSTLTRSIPQSSGCTLYASMIPGDAWHGRQALDVVSFVLLSAAVQGRVCHRFFMV